MLIYAFKTETELELEFFCVISIDLLTKTGREKKKNRDTKKTENGGCKEKPEARLLAALDVLINDPVHELPLFALEASPVATAVSTLLFLSAAQFSSRLGFVFFFLIFIFNETHRHHHRCSCSRHHRHRRPPPMRQRR